MPVGLRTLSEFTIASTLVFALLWATPSQGDQQSVIAPNPVIQEKISELSKAIRDANKDGGKEQVFRAMDDLERASKQNKTELIRQLIWHHSKSSDVNEGMTLVYALHFLELPKDTVGFTIAPLFGQMGNEELNHAVVHVANIIEAADAQRGSTFGHYRGYLLACFEKNRDFNHELMAHMIHQGPGEALQTVATAICQNNEQKQFLWARHVVDDLLWRRQFGFADRAQPEAAAVEELEKMANREEWWARLYAAEIIQQHPELGTPKIVEQLKADSHELVRRALLPDK